MTTEKALDILERHNLWRRGADYVDATDPRLLGMALDKAIKVLRLSNVVGQSEQLKNAEQEGYKKGWEEGAQYGYSAACEGR
mgnify:CR=1 FL=1